MLVVTRRINEGIEIAGTIEVRILSVRGSTVRLGIAAPAAISIVRKELLDAQKPIGCGGVTPHYTTS